MIGYVLFLAYLLWPYLLVIPALAILCGILNAIYAPPQRRAIAHRRTPRVELPRGPRVDLPPPVRVL